MTLPIYRGVALRKLAEIERETLAAREHGLIDEHSADLIIKALDLIGDHVEYVATDPNALAAAAYDHGPTLVHDSDEETLVLG